MIRGLADLMLVNRPSLRLGVSLTGITARVAAAIAGEDPELVVPLMEGLQGDLLPADDRAAELLNVRLHSFRAAVEHALCEWDALEPLPALCWMSASYARATATFLRPRRHTCRNDEPRKSLDPHRSTARRCVEPGHGSRLTRGLG